MDRNTITALLEAFAVGDALGMPTEFMRRDEIRERFGLVDRILDPTLSWTHPGLRFASVTDDTEQLWRLVRTYLRGGIGVDRTVDCLFDWIRETDAVGKRYIGPSSLRALEAIRQGGDPRETGRTGTTCGGVMRSPAAVLALLAGAEPGPPPGPPGGAGAPGFPEATDAAAAAGATGTALAASTGRAAPPGDPLERAVLYCLMPTHNTRAALEAACAYSFALREALRSGPGTGATGTGATAARFDAILDAALSGAARGVSLSAPGFPGPASGARIAHLRRLVPAMRSVDEVLDFLYGVLGSGIESAEVCAAVFGIFLFAGSDVMLALSMGASVGGDTDTIAALAGALCAAFARGHNIPRGLVETVVRANGLDPAGLAAELADHAARSRGK